MEAKSFYNAEAEKAILGAILLDNSTYYQSVEILREGAKHFFSAGHQAMYKAMTALMESGLGVDPITLQEELRRSSELDIAGGAAYIGQLIDGLPRFSNIEDHCRVVIEAWKRARVAEIAHATTNQALAGEVQSDDLIAQSCNNLALVSSCTDMRRPELIGNLTNDRLSSYEAAAAAETFVTGLATGFRELDYVLGGLQKQLHYVAARPRVGKTAFACSLMSQAAAIPENDNPVILFFSIESGRDQITDRMLAMTACVDSSRMRLGMLTKSEWRQVVDAKATLDSRRIIVDDRTFLTVPILKAVAQQIKRREKRLDLIVIDYCQRLRAHSVRNGMNRTNELQQVSNDLQAAQKELDTCVVGLIQAGREVEQRADKRVTLADLRESATWEQDGRVILTLYREKVYDENAGPEAEISIIKNNKGRSGCTEKMAFIESYAKYESTWREEARP